MSFDLANNDELAFITEILAQFDEVSQHGKILETISTNAKRLSGVSIFSGNQGDKESSSSRNILKTEKDFDKMADIFISYEITHGLTIATDFLATDIIAILFMLLLAARLIYDEKEKGAFFLIKSTPRGRLSTISAKIITLAITMLVMTVLLIGSNLLYSGVMFGMPSFNATIQSIPSFIRSTIPISIGEYIIIFLFICIKF